MGGPGSGPKPNRVRRRRVVDAALSRGEVHAWDFQPHRDASKLYVRSTMPLDDIEAMAGEAPPGYSSGGMVTKLAAARIAINAGCRMLIAQGWAEPAGPDGPLAAIEAGARATLFLPGGERFVAKEWWNGESGFEYGPAWVTRDTKTGRVVSESIEQGKGYSQLVQSPDLAHFVGLYENRLTVYRIDDLAAPVVTVKNDSKKDYTGAAFHPGGRVLAATSNDNTVKWRRLSLQLPPSRLRPHFVKATVRVHEYPDGLLAVFWGPHLLAHYDAAGRIIHHEQLAA